MEEKFTRLLSEEIDTINPSLARPLKEKQRQLLLRYLKLLLKWNKAYNLTAIREPEEMIKKHIVDSLMVLPMLQESFQHQTEPTLVDVGSGAGLPGIPIAIAHPDWKIALVDSNGKKTSFLMAVKTELGLENVTIINSRAENINQTFDAVICRAFASLDDIVTLTKKMWHEKTCLWAMKGKYPAEELRGLPKSYRVCSSYELTPAGIANGERHLLKITHQPVAPHE